MLDFETLRNKMQLDTHLEVLDMNGYLIQEGINGETTWEDVLLDKKVYSILPGISTKIILEKD